MAPVADSKEMGPRPPTWAGATLKSAIGAPSARLSLGGLRARRARLRFTWRPHHTGLERFPARADLIEPVIREKLLTGLDKSAFIEGPGKGSALGIPRRVLDAAN